MQYLATMAATCAGSSNVGGAIVSGMRVAALLPATLPSSIARTVAVPFGTAWRGSGRASEPRRSRSSASVMGAPRKPAAISFSVTRSSSAAAHESAVLRRRARPSIISHTSASHASFVPRNESNRTRNSSTVSSCVTGR